MNEERKFQLGDRVQMRVKNSKPGTIDQIAIGRWGPQCHVRLDNGTAMWVPEVDLIKSEKKDKDA